MKAVGLFLVAVLSLITFFGCKSEATGLPQIEGQPYRTVSPQSKFSAFSSLPTVTAEPDPDGVTFNGVGFGADGAYIMVSFTPTGNVTNKLQQDYVWVVDEETRMVYKDVPVLPIVGPLIGRPAREGQGAYVMLMNYGGSVKSGSKVSVVIGKYKREHILVP